MLTRAWLIATLIATMVAPVCVNALDSSFVAAGGNKRFTISPAANMTGRGFIATALDRGKSQPPWPVSLFTENR